MNSVTDPKRFSIISSIVCLLFLIAGCKHHQAIHPQKKDIVETVYASGKIMADSEYTVYALNPGVVVAKRFVEGDQVRKNNILYVINNDAPAARLDAANATFTNAKQNLSTNSRVLNDLEIAMQSASIRRRNDSLQYCRLKALWAENVGTRSALDNAEAQYQISLNDARSAQEKYFSTVNDLKVSLKNAGSQVTGAQNDLNNSIIRSESAGTVFQMLKEKGEAVKANEAVALIGKSSARIIRLAVDQQDVNLVKEGQQVLLKTDATADKIYKAKIQRIYPTMNEADQTFRVDAVFDAEEKQPYIHTSVEANIIIQQKQQVLVIPSQALLHGDSVTIKRNGKVMSIAVKAGIRTLNEVEILSGISESDEIIEAAVK
jgi:HlyD family secretion protein